jgi:hypothetical protein
LHLSQLCNLEISVREVIQEDMDILGSLPRLQRLALLNKRQSRLLLVGADGFHGLTYFRLFSHSPGQVVFQPGAMPKAETFHISMSLRIAKEEAAAIGGDWFGLSMENHPSLRQVLVWFFRSGVTVGEAKQAEAALENAVRAHPNRPGLNILFQPRIPRGM